VKENEMDPENSTTEADTAIRDLITQADAAHAEIQTYRNDTRYRPEYADQLATKARDNLQQTIADTNTRVQELLDSAARDADVALAKTRTPTSPEQIAAQQLASTRVRATLDALGPASAAEVLAEDGDVAGLRELYAAIPTYTAVALKNEPAENRQAHIAELRASVERRLEAVASPEEQAAIRGRARINDLRAALDSAVSYSFSPSPTKAIALGYSVPEVNQPVAPQQAPTVPFWQALRDYQQ